MVGAVSFIVGRTTCEHSYAFVGCHGCSKVPLVDALWSDKRRKTGVPVKWSLCAEGETFLG